MPSNLRPWAEPIWAATIGDLLDDARTSGAAGRRRALVERWQIKPLDAFAVETLSQLELVWRNWLYEERALLVAGVEAIAHSELAESQRNEKDNRNLLDRALLATQALRLARDLEGDQSVSGRALLIHCCEYALQTFHDMSRASPLFRKLTARQMAERIAPLARSRPGRITWVCISDLVWLAMERRNQKPTERQLRAYVDKRTKLPKSAVHKLWNRNWDHLGFAARIVRESRTTRPAT